jgi:hypothetical protein
MYYMPEYRTYAVYGGNHPGKLRVLAGQWRKTSVSDYIFVGPEVRYYITPIYDLRERLGEIGDMASILSSGEGAVAVFGDIKYAPSIFNGTRFVFADR